MISWLSIQILVLLSVSILVYVIMSQIQVFFADYKNTFQEAADVNMSDMFMFVEPSKLFLYNIGALIIVPLVFYVLTGDILIAIGAFTALLILPPTMYKIMRNNRLKKFELQLPDTLLMITGALKAGASLNMAMESIVRESPAPMSQEITLLMRQQRLGVEFSKSLDTLEERVPIQSVFMFVAALKISREIGGNLGETLGTLAETLRRKITMEGKIDSLTGQGKMQGWVMSALPIFLAVLLSYIEPENMQKLYTTTSGFIVLAIVIVMEILGYVFIKKVTTIDV
ncbi:MAG: type II secretion system F family protein [Gammaproteobacteria bacterium]|nr:type II secretion system F family protein [Gammaproteobacteria bacterium]